MCGLNQVSIIVLLQYMDNIMYCHYNIREPWLERAEAAERAKIAAEERERALQEENAKLRFQSLPPGNLLLILNL